MPKGVKSRLSKSTQRQNQSKIQRQQHQKRDSKVIQRGLLSRLTQFLVKRWKKDSNLLSPGRAQLQFSAQIDLSTSIQQRVSVGRRQKTTIFTDSTAIILILIKDIKFMMEEKLSTITLNNSQSPLKQMQSINNFLWQISIISQNMENDDDIMHKKLNRIQLIYKIIKILSIKSANFVEKIIKNILNQINFTLIIIQLLVNTKEMKDINLKCQAKIKSISQYAIKGTRLFPTQVFTADTHKNVNVHDDLSNSSYSNNIRPLAFENQPNFLRFSNRHSTEIPGLKPANLRLSLNHINQNRTSQPQNSGNRSDRDSGIQDQSDIEVRKIALDQSGSQKMKSLLMENREFNVFKDLHIQKITSSQTKIDQRQFESYSKNSIQLQNKQFQPNSIKQISQEQAKATNQNMWQRLYLQYRQKCTSMQKDNRQMINKLKDAESSAQILQQQKSVILNNCHKFQLKMEEQQKKITKLEQSIKINRTINQQLMRKEKQIERQIKLIEKNNDMMLKKQQQNLKTQIFLEISSKFEEDRILYEKQIFQLKLKIIDQANQFQQSNKEKQAKKLQLLHQIKKISQQLSIIRRQNIDLNAQVAVTTQQRSYKFMQLAEQNLHLKTCIEQLNDQILKRTCQIVRIDQQNLRLDQEIVKISDQYQNLLTISNDQIDQLSNQCQNLQRQRQQLIDILQNRDGQIAQLNIAKNNALIQILQLKKKFQDRKETGQTNKFLLLKKQEIQLLKEQTIIKNGHFETQIQRLSIQNEEFQTYIANLKEKYQQQYSAKWKENEQLMGQNLLFKLEMLQQLKQSTQQIKQLRQKFSNEQKKKEEFRMINMQIQSQKAMLQELAEQKSQIITKLNQQINQLESQLEKFETLRSKQLVLQNRENELKQIQQEYLDLIEGELKKIQFINDNQWDSAQDQPAYGFFSTPRKSRKEYDQLQKGLSPHQTPQKESQQSSPKEQEVQSEVDQLKMRVQELTFVNEALQNKVESLNEVQEKSNKIILDKIKTFQDDLEKILHQKNQLEVHNSQLLNRIAQITEKCLFYENKNEQLENIYRQLQANHFQTQQELLRSNIQYVNLKLMKKIVDDQEQLNQNDDLLTQNVESQKIMHHGDILQILQEKNQVPASYKQQKIIQKGMSPQNSNLIHQDLTKMQRQIMQQQITQDFVVNKSIQVSNYDDQLLLQNKYNQDPQISINILVVSSEDEDIYQDEYPLINIVAINSPCESDKQQEIEEVFSYEQSIQYKQLIEDPGYQQQVVQRHEEQVSNEEKRQKNEDYSFAFEALIKDIIERAQRNEILQQQQQKKAQKYQTIQETSNNIEPKVFLKENQLDVVQ